MATQPVGPLPSSRSHSVMRPPWVTLASASSQLGPASGRGSRCGEAPLEPARPGLCQFLREACGQGSQLHSPWRESPQPFPAERQAAATHSDGGHGARIPPTPVGSLKLPVPLQAYLPFSQGTMLSASGSPGGGGGVHRGSRSLMWPLAPSDARAPTPARLPPSLLPSTVLR